LQRAIRFAPRAIDDLETALGWLSQPGSGARATRRRARILQAIRRLIDRPCLYALSRHANHREFTAAGYRIIYRLNPDTGRNDTSGDIEILRVFGPGQSRETV
jgi:plasmid stabilization system protein ParE